MASTRHAGAFHIFQDSTVVPTTFPQMNKPRPQLQPSPMPLQPITNIAPRPEPVLTPPMSAPQQPSPLKSAILPSPPKPNYPSLNYIPVPPPQSHIHFTDSPVKKPPPQLMRTYCAPATQRQPLFTTFNSNIEMFEKENTQPSNSRNEEFVDFPDPSYPRKQPTLKRSYSESIQPQAPINPQPVKRPRLEETRILELPEPEDMPPVEDDGNKPTCSYAQMIGMAILRAPNRRLTLSQIYEWIAKTFSYYRLDPKRGWHNSIRHNLSLNKAFEKQERPKSDVGKGSYWIIVPGMEMTFLKDKTKKSNGMASMTIHAHPIQQDIPPQPLAEALAPNPWLGPTRPQTAPALPELSSDATLPASDPALEEDDAPLIDAPMISKGPQSSPPDAINSSPPVVYAAHRRGASSPMRPPQIASGNMRKRVSTVIDDSGYFSSLESSALRPNKAKVVLTSEIDLDPPRLKHGRAEEEIARIRSSSHDLTPSHRRIRSLGSDEMLSSSPVRPSPASKLNPATPSVVFKKPMRPPPSISPNTQLRNHRKAMSAFTNSPIKSVGWWATENDTYSPAFKFQTPAVHNVFDDTFEVFSDTHGTAPATPALSSSPLKHSARGSSLARATVTANILSDITVANTKINAKTPSKIPVLKPTPRIYSPASPGKDAQILIHNFDDQEELFDFGGFLDENSDDGEGVDILKGFQKIGGNGTKSTTTTMTSPRKRRNTSRPGLGARSITSRF